MKKLKIFSIFAILLLIVAALFSCEEKVNCDEGHTYGEPEVTEEATCKNEGRIRSVCTVCGIAEEKSVERVDHKYEDNCCIWCQRSSLTDMSFKLNDDGRSYTLEKYNNSNVKEITIPSTFGGKPVTVIGVGAFSDLPNLEKVTIPASVTDIERSAFASCGELKTVTLPEGLKRIDDSVFLYCRKLTDVKLPSTLETIGVYAFSNCEALDKITLPEGVKALGADAFANCNSLTEVTLPASVTEIPDYLFYSCTNVRTVTMLGEVTKIGEKAFAGMHSLERVSAKGTPELGNGAFSGCRNLYNLDIENGVGNIGDGAFSGCYSLNSITLSKSLQSIGNNAFRDCVRLVLIRNYSSLAIDSQNNPGKIRDYARAMTKNENDNRYKIEYVNDFVILVVDSDHIKVDQTVEKHRSYYLIDYIGTDVSPVFPTFETPEEYTVDGYTIAKYAFYDMDQYTGDENILFADLPMGVTTIEEHAFYRCDRLLRIFVPKSVTYASTYIHNCGSNSSLVEVINCNPDAYRPEKNSDKNDPPFRYSVEYDNVSVDAASDITIVDDFIIFRRGAEWHVLGYVGNEKVLNIPAPPEGYKYYIHYNAFKNYNAEGVVLPEGVVEIRDEAFAGSFILTDLVFPSTLEKIGYRAFEGATFGDLVVPDNVKVIENNAFDRAIYNSITLPVGADINRVMQHDCYDEEGMFWLGDILISTDSSIVSGDVVIKDGAVQLANGSFRGNNNITSVVVPDSVKYLGSCVFLECEKLKTITIPSSVIRIGDSTLPDTSYSNMEFEKVIYGGTKEQWLALTEGKNLCGGTYTVECSDGTLTIEYTRH